MLFSLGCSCSERTQCRALYCCSCVCGLLHTTVSVVILFSDSYAHSSELVLISLSEVFSHTLLRMLVVPFLARTAHVGCSFSRPHCACCCSFVCDLLRALYCYAAVFSFIVSGMLLIRCLGFPISILRGV